MALGDRTALDQLKLPFALQWDKPACPALRGAANLQPSLIAQKYRARIGFASYTCRDIHGVAPQVVHELTLTNDTGDDGTKMNSDTYFPAGFERFRSCRHFQSALHAGENRIFDFLQQTTGRQKSVADCLDFFHFMGKRNFLKGLYQPLQLTDDSFRRCAIAIRGKPDDVAK